jgi:hypothetical protein
MYAKPSSVLDSFAPHVLVADCGFLLVGTKDRSAGTAEGTCNRLPISVTQTGLVECTAQGALRAICLRIRFSICLSLSQAATTALGVCPSPLPYTEYTPRCAR